MADGHPLISIIVPFYNIESCVSYCMESLLSQTFDDYEVICVDDGSTDGTGMALDAYSNCENVVVYHKENGGLSEARNFGVRMASSELVSFVDGDDIVSPFYLEALHACYLVAEGGMAIGTTQYLEEDDVRASSLDWPMPGDAERLTKQDIITRYCYEEILPSACCRLAPLELYRNRPFPSGAFYEEIATAAGYVSDANSFAFVNTPLYGYVMRSGSIVHRRQARFKQIEDYITAINSFEEAASELMNDEAAKIYFECLQYSRIYRLLDVVTDCSDDAEVGRLRKEIIATIRTDLGKLIGDKNISFGNKMRFIVLSLTPMFYSRCFGCYERFRNRMHL